MKRDVIKVTLLTEDAKPYDVLVYYGYDSPEDIEIYEVLRDWNGSNIFDTLDDDDVSCIIDCVRDEQRSEWLSNFGEYYQPLDPTDSPRRVVEYWEEKERDFDNN